MALVALDGMPLIPVGNAGREGFVGLAALAASTISTANDAIMMIGQIYTEDGGSHTIDSTGSSSLGWRSATVTFSNAGTTVKVGLATVDMATGPPARAVNATNVITFDVARSLTGGSGITANAWQEHAPNAGSKTITNGDLVAFCIQMTAKGGTDSITVGTMPTATTGNTIIPSITTFASAAYSTVNRLPNAVITFSDGKLGFFWGGMVASVGTSSTTFNNTSATKEYGNYIKMPFPATIYGMIASCNVTGNLDAILYSDPLGTPVAQRTTSLDLNAIGAAFQNQYNPILFSSPYQATASQPLAAILKPTSATDITANYCTLNVSAHQKAHSCGINAYAVNRASGAFAAQNANKDRYAVGLLVGGFDAGGTAGRMVQINNDSVVA